MQDIKKTQIELLEMKTIICEMEKVLNGNSDTDFTIENTSEPEDTAIETVPK